MNTVKIGGNKIKLVYSSPNDWNVNGLGRCYVDKIVINEELNNDMKANTFLHELLHYIVDLNGLVIQDNETEVSVLAMLYMLL